VRLTPHAGFGGKLPGKDPGSCNMNTGLAGQLTLPNDAFSVAVAALRSPAPRPVIADDHAVVLKIWAKRHRDLAREGNRGTTLPPGRPAHTPHTGTSGKSLPGLPPR